MAVGSITSAGNDVTCEQSHVTHEFKLSLSAHGRHVCLHMTTLPAELIDPVAMFVYM
jgi:hypothetical protein